LKKGNNLLAASIPTLPGGALKGGGKQFFYLGLFILSPSLKGLFCFFNWNCYKKTGYEL